MIEAQSIHGINAKQLKQCILNRVDQDVNISNLHQTNEAIKDFKLNLDIQDSDDRIWTLHSDYIQALENAGFSNLSDKKTAVFYQTFSRNTNAIVFKTTD